MSSITRTEMSSIKDKNVFNYKDKIVLKLQEQKCPQIMRITMSLITRTKMSSNYKDKIARTKMSSIARTKMSSNYEDNNVLNCKTEMSSNYEDNNDRNVLKYEDKSVLIVGQKSCPHSCEDKNVLKVARTKYTQFTRTTMALITRIKLSSSYKDRNVLKL
ncbi:hypothetical protein GLOIN_2v1761555 [Rhizophagus irregularis DAOM 181602=DAOM 197198]|nr:hypothetical protein GLOIN_2v1761555 [Rhizophagus irregularis DAOM 181602=DAOM 197198]